MQYVAGATLERVILRMYDGSRVPERGRAILDVVDSLNAEPVAFDPAAMRDRARIEADDFVQAACWMGARLAEALAYAHSRGVLHCDIKPANILVNRYGRPLLADFNVAADLSPERSPESRIGGTLPYMSPEHIEAFLGGPGVSIDARSDVYSLGLVLFELLTGLRAFESTQPPLSRARLERLAIDRRATVPAPREFRPDIPEVLDRVIRRCVAPRPEQRFGSADELARALEGCRALRHAECLMPAPGPLTRRALHRPFWVGLCLFLLPHLIGSIVNISYNTLQIVHDLNEAQQTAFAQVTLVYNAVVYSYCIGVVVVLIVPIIRMWRTLRLGGLPHAEVVARERRRALSLPGWAVRLSCLGWFPGAVLFPLFIHWRAGPLEPAVFVHFFTSFTISGLIALTYAVFATQYLAVRVLYPKLWSDPQGFSASARSELESQGGRLWLFQLLAGLIPLAGAVLMVGVGPEAVASYRTYRILVTAMIGLGMAGFGLALAVSQYINRVLAVLTGAGHEGRG
jgi:hypothetical protein